jgi:2-keto-4-pentenoate hydratase/2-oxohepta-3-ene-1,7-dioic acid hydratase in catechol pathway
MKNGMAEGEEITVISGSFWNRYEETDRKYSISKISFLPPVLPAKIVCVGQNYPGDIVTTGTPQGIAPMQPGERVEVEIEGVGSLRNSVVAQA